MKMFKEQKTSFLRPKHEKLYHDIISLLIWQILEKTSFKWISKASTSFDKITYIHSKYSILNIMHNCYVPKYFLTSKKQQYTPLPFKWLSSIGSNQLMAQIFFQIPNCWNAIFLYYLYFPLYVKIDLMDTPIREKQSTTW